MRECVKFALEAIGLVIATGLGGGIAFGLALGSAIWVLKLFGVQP